jgi:hypothetical protein
MRLGGAKNTSVRRIHAAWTKRLYMDEIKEITVGVEIAALDGERTR